jgi:antitoxin component of MazEF toxin-antitoxin module
MKTHIKKIGNKLFIEIPNSIEKLYNLKETPELSMYIIEKNNSFIISCVLLNSNKGFENS